jgi:hypothetical protein
VQDVNVTNLGTTLVTYTLASVPSGVQVNALVRGYMYNSTATVNGLLIPTGDGSTVSNTPSGNDSFLTPSTSTGAVGTFNLWTSTSQQIKAAASAVSTTLLRVTYGWVDTRGRFN